MTGCLLYMRVPPAAEMVGMWFSAPNVLIFSNGTTRAALVRVPWAIWTPANDNGWPHLAL